MREFYLIEPTQIMRVFTRLGHYDFGIVALYWLVNRLHIELEDEFAIADARLKVMKVTHHFPENTYPTLAVEFDASLDQRGLKSLESLIRRNHNSFASEYSHY